MRHFACADSTKMAKKKTKAKAPEPEKKKPPPSVPERVGGFLYRPRVLLIVAAIASATFLLPMARSLLPELREHSEYQVSVSQIEVNAAPRWVPHDLVEQAANRAGLADHLSILDEDLTTVIAEAFQLHPWVAEVKRVEKTYPARIQVELSYRRPVAMVQLEQGMYPVDTEGFLLPPNDFSVADTKRFPVIRNASSTPQGPSGTSWGDAEVVGAARLAEVLYGVGGPNCHWRKFGFAAISIPSQKSEHISADNLAYELTTTSGSRIIWGRSPGSDHPGELSPEQKLGRLEKYLHEFQTFEHPRGPYEIDIRHWQEISRRPLASRTARSLH
jgi:cell division septal protein FtsQ